MEKDPSFDEGERGERAETDERAGPDSSVITRHGDLSLSYSREPLHKYVGDHTTQIFIDHSERGD